MPDTEIFFKEPQALALAKAIERGDIKAIRQIASQIDINQQHERGMTFLNWAIARLNYESAETLLQLKADPHIETEGRSPFSLALFNDDVRWLKLLVEYGADINAKRHKSPLWLNTIPHNNWEHFDYILDKGVNINATSEIGRTAIFKLASYGDYGRVLKLIDKGADVHIVTTGGKSFARHVQERDVEVDHPEYENREKVIKILEKAGYNLPVPSPQEVRDEWAKNQ